MPSTLTVVIATKNSATNAPFRDCMDSVRRQRTTCDVRIVVVDGGSSDDTLSVARSFGATILDNPAVTELGFPGGKNLALRRIESEFVSMVDADNVLIENDYLDQMTRPLIENPLIDVAVPTPYVPALQDAPSIMRYFCRREQDYWFDLSRGGVRRDSWIEFDPVFAVIPNAGILRTAVIKGIGGWDYDTEVAARLIASGHGKFALVPTAHRFHAEMADYREVVRKLSRRMANQFRNYSQKPQVGRELETATRRPMQTTLRELINPLSRIATVGDWSYIHAFPVLTIRVILLVKWQSRRRPSTEVAG